MKVTETAPRYGERQKRGWNDVVLTLTGHGRTVDRVLAITPKHMAAVAVILVVWAFGSAAIDDYTKHADSDARRPQMESLANAGGDEAAVWLVKHYFPQERHRLPALVAKGNVEATFMQGAVRVHEGDKEGGMAQIEQAAARGWLPAIQYIEWHKS